MICLLIVFSIQSRYWECSKYLHINKCSIIVFMCAASATDPLQTVCYICDEMLWGPKKNHLLNLWICQRQTVFADSSQNLKLKLLPAFHISGVDAFLCGPEFPLALDKYKQTQDVNMAFRELWWALSLFSDILLAEWFILKMNQQIRTQI